MDTVPELTSEAEFSTQTVSKALRLYVGTVSVTVMTEVKVVFTNDPALSAAVRLV